MIYVKWNINGLNYSADFPQCKDCKHYEPDNCEHGHCRICFFNKRTIGLDGVMPMPTNANDFCSRGERK